MIDLPNAKRKQMHTAMKRQEALTRNEYDCPVEYVDAYHLFMLQRGRCKCGCKKMLDIEGTWDAKSPPAGYPVVAHALARIVKHSPGHVLGNVWWWRHECNAREAAPENRARGKANKFAVNKILAPTVAERKAKPKPKYKWPTRSIPTRKKRG